MSHACMSEFMDIVWRQPGLRMQPAAAGAQQAPDS